MSAERQLPLWDIEAFLKATEGRPIGDLPDQVSGISIDTRTLVAGDAFFAIKGDRFDGHTFITKAASMGAGLAVVSENKLASLGAVNLPLVVVHDVLEAMERLGKAARQRSSAKIIAITGSVGKTSTKEMVRTLLQSSGRVHAALASFNNHWGVPLTLSRMRPDTDYGVFEIGMNHPGEITPLVDMVQPHVAVITTVAAAHLGFFKNIEEIAQAKAEIFSGIVNNGTALVNCDIEQFKLLKKIARKEKVSNILTFGEHKDADYRLMQIGAGSAGSNLELDLNGERVEVHLAMAGRHMALNLLAAMGAAKEAGAETEKLVQSVEQVGGVKGRGETTTYGEGRRACKIIDESYNANPASMRAALDVLGMNVPTGKGRRVAVLGDMLELGKSAKELHEQLLDPIRQAKVDKVWLVGSEMEALASKFDDQELAGHYKSVEEMKELFLKDLTPGDVVMIKASLGIGFGPLVAAAHEYLA